MTPIQGKRQRIKQFYIPEEIIRSILVKIPAWINYNVMRHVCTEWRDIILHDSGFINTHLRHSIHGMLLCGREANYFYEMTTTNSNDHDSVIKTSKLESIIDGSTIRSTCNGLVLYSKTDSTKLNEVEFHVANPTTKQDLVLPSSCSIPDYYHNYHLGFASGTGEYKVVRVCLIHVLACEIRTLGSDQGWRSVDTKSLSAKVVNYVYSHSVGAFIHWIDHDHTCLLSLNLETETFRELLINVPRGVYRKCLVMGDKLTLFVTAKRPVEVSFEIWILMEGESNGAEWMKLCDILLPKSICSGLPIYPIAWLKPMELVVFYVTSFTNIYIAHDFRTGKIHRFSKENFHKSLSFVNSLVRINT